MVFEFEGYQRLPALDGRGGGIGDFPDFVMRISFFAHICQWFQDILPVVTPWVLKCWRLQKRLKSCRIGPIKVLKAKKSVGKRLRSRTDRDVF